jgi:prevent-host-death family protein
MVWGKVMDILNVSIAEAKKNFSRMIRTSEEKKQRVVILRRGNPVAIILPYGEYQKSRKEEAFKKIKETAAIYRASGMSAEQVYEISKNELEEKR